MDRSTFIAFLIMVFGAVFFLAQVIIVPAFGTSRQEMNRLKKRMALLEAEDLDGSSPLLLLRERFRRKPTRLERWLSWIPGVPKLAETLEQPGQKVPAYGYIFSAIVLALVGGLGGWLYFGKPLVVLAGVGLGWLPFLKLRIDQARRFAKFEEQLPVALETMTRALSAGYPFTETLRQVAKEMEDPIAMEFRMAFDEINGGMEIRRALRNMLNRVPSMTLMALVTTVMLQRETGGNLAESMQKIGGLIRGRYKFQRGVRTLTAEGRMSAWVLALMPFVMFGVLSLMMPDKIREFVSDPTGQQMIYISLGLMVAGILWLRALLNIDI